MDTKYKVSFVGAKYRNNGSLAIRAVCDNGEPYGMVTVNLPETNLCKDGECYLDMNNCEELNNELIKQGYLTLLGGSAVSGFCLYPKARIEDKFRKEIEL